MFGQNLANLNLTEAFLSSPDLFHGYWQIFRNRRWKDGAILLHCLEIREHTWEFMTNLNIIQA